MKNKAGLIAIFEELENDFKKCAEYESTEEIAYCYGFLRASVIHALSLQNGEYFSKEYKEKRDELEKY